jgi:hypothetical protein
MLSVVHFCECSAGCEVITPHWKHYCEHHSEELLVLEVDTLLDDGCPRCRLRAPEGLHLHHCSKRILTSRLKSRSGGTPNVIHEQLSFHEWLPAHPTDQQSVAMTRVVSESATPTQQLQPTSPPMPMLADGATRQRVTDP